MAGQPPTEVAVSDRLFYPLCAFGSFGSLQVLEVFLFEAEVAPAPAAPPELPRASIPAVEVEAELEVEVVAELEVEAEPEAVAPAEPAPAPPSKLLLRLVDPVSGEVISQLALDDPSEKSIDDSKQELGLDARSVVATRSDDGVLVSFEDGTISVQAAAEERGAKVVSAELKVCSLAAFQCAKVEYGVYNSPLSFPVRSVRFVATAFLSAY